MKIHCLGVICVTAAGFFFDISATEWCICLILFGLILGLELVNTAVEAVVDLVLPLCVDGITTFSIMF